MRLEVQLHLPVWNYFKDSLTVHSCCQVVATVEVNPSLVGVTRQTRVRLQCELLAPCLKCWMKDTYLHWLVARSVKTELKAVITSVCLMASIHMLQCRLSKEWHYAELPVTTKMLGSLSVDSCLCRRAPSCLHRCPAGFQSCTWTFPGSPPTFRFPPSKRKGHQTDQPVASACNSPLTRAGADTYNTHHVGSVDGRGHLDFPEVLAVCEFLGSADGSCAAAVVRVKTHLPVVAAEEGAGRLEVVVPLPVKTFCGEHTVTFFLPPNNPSDFNMQGFLSFCSASLDVELRSHIIPFSFYPGHPRLIIQKISRKQHN